MYKQAADTVNPNDANNPLPAALMLGAIGGVAGLGGSLLSKKQRKHKLRNTLLGATALPAAFLAANKWGPEAVKGKLNEFSGNVYDQYAKHIQGKLPESMRTYIDSKTLGGETDGNTEVLAAREKQRKADEALTAANNMRATAKNDLTNAEKRQNAMKTRLTTAESSKNKAQEAYDKHTSNPFTPVPLTPRPTYDGKSKEDYDAFAETTYKTRAQELENKKKDTQEIDRATTDYETALKTIEEEESAAKQKYNEAVGDNDKQTETATMDRDNLEKELEGKRKTYEQFDTQERQALDRIKTVMEQASGSLDNPESTDAWKDISKQLETLTQGQRAAVIERLKREGDAGRLSPRAQQQYNIISHVLTNLNNQRIDAVNTLEMGKKQRTANETALAQARQALEARQKQNAEGKGALKNNLQILKQQLDSARSEQYTKADRSNANYQKALSRHKEEDAKIQALEELVNLAKDDKPGRTDAVAKRLIDEGNIKAKELYDSVVEQRKLYNEKYSTQKRNEAIIAAQNKRREVIKAEEEQRVSDELNTWMTQHRGQTPPPELVDVDLVTQRILKATDARMREENPRIEAWAGKQFDQAASNDNMYHKGKAERALRDHVDKVVADKQTQLIELRDQLAAKMKQEQVELAKNIKLLQDKYDAINTTYTGFNSDTKELEADVVAKEQALQRSIENMAKYEEAVKQIDSHIDQIYNYDVLSPVLQQFSDEYKAENITPLEQQLQDIKDAFNAQVEGLRERSEGEQAAAQDTYAAKRLSTSGEMAGLSNKIQELSNKITKLKQERAKLDAGNKTTMDTLSGRRGVAESNFTRAKEDEQARLADIATQLGQLKTEYEQERAKRDKADTDWSRTRQEEDKTNREGEARWGELKADLRAALENAQSEYDTAYAGQTAAEQEAEELQSIYDQADEERTSANGAYNNAVKGNEDTTSRVKARRRKHQNQALAATGGGAGLVVLLSALNKLRKRKKKEISPEEYLNYLEEEGMA